MMYTESLKQSANIDFLFGITLMRTKSFYNASRYDYMITDGRPMIV